MAITDTTPTAQPSLSSYLNSVLSNVGQNAGSTGIQALASQLGLGGTTPELSLSGILGLLGSAGLKSAGGIMGDNPVLPWMTSQLSSTLGGLLNIPALGTGATISPGVNSMAGNLIGKGLGTVLGNVVGNTFSGLASQIAPFQSMVTMEAGQNYTNPYASYASNIPLIGPGIAMLFEAFGSRDEKMQKRIGEAITPIFNSGAKRVEQLKAQGYTDYDIYGIAKMNNMYVEGNNGQITGMYTGEETTAMSQLRGATTGGGPTGWVYDPSQGWTSYSPASMYTGAYGTGDVANLPSSWWEQQYQKEAPSNLLMSMTGNPYEGISPTNESGLALNYGTTVAGTHEQLLGSPTLSGENTSKIPWYQTVANPTYSESGYNQYTAEAQRQTDLEGNMWPYMEGGWYQSPPNPYAAYNVSKEITTPLWQMTPEQQAAFFNKTNEIQPAISSTLGSQPQSLTSVLEQQAGTSTSLGEVSDIQPLTPIPSSLNPSFGVLQRIGDPQSLSKQLGTNSQFMEELLKLI